jgi:hypothetical protein
LKNASSEKISTEVKSLKATHGELERSKSQFMDECSFEKKNYKRRNLNILNNNN